MPGLLGMRGLFSLDPGSRHTDLTLSSRVAAYRRSIATNAGAIAGKKGSAPLIATSFSLEKGGFAVLIVIPAIILAR
ncbi:MAG: hypothetical protein OXG62_00290 [Nitrospinae bacterium]|nr:hypothetical protein [Nitrospinota bacterium]